MGISCHYNYSKDQRHTQRAGLKIFVSSFFTAGFTAQTDRVWLGVARRGVWGPDNWCPEQPL